MEGELMVVLAAEGAWGGMIFPRSGGFRMCVSFWEGYCGDG